MTQVYDFEHLGDDDDILFYCRLSERLSSKTILELGCGTGRITRSLAELTAQGDISITGLDSEPEMLAKAQLRLEEAWLRFASALPSQGATCDPGRVFSNLI